MKQKDWLWGAMIAIGICLFISGIISLGIPAKVEKRIQRNLDWSDVTVHGCQYIAFWRTASSASLFIVHRESCTNNIHGIRLEK